MALLAYLRIRLLLSLLLCMAYPSASEAGETTELVVVGTVHQATANFKLDDLVRILERVKPDLILFEVDSSFVDEETHQLAERYRKVTLEAEAVTAYRTKSRVPLRPYDIEGRNRIYKEHNYFELERKFSTAILSLYQNGKLSAEGKVLFEALAALSKVRDAIGSDRPEVINSGASDCAIEQKQRYAHAGLNRIVELTSDLSGFADFRKFAAEFWDRRNATMASNIIAHAKKLPGKRVVVLCGFEHRYYLLKLLKAETTNANVLLREFYEIH